ATRQSPKEIEAVKFWVLRGFQAYFNQARGENAPLRIRNEEREQRCILALMTYLHRKPPEEIVAFLNRKPAEDATAEEDLSLRPLQEQLAALHYIRREAVKAIGETRHP